MYQAEIRGKLSSKTEELEDILTSNVFSFFKYSNRQVFLQPYLSGLGFDITPADAIEAEFRFWPQYEDGTEPDLVLIVGKYYILFEAKHHSDFVEETPKIKAQLIREIEGGLAESGMMKRRFRLVAITAHYYYMEQQFPRLPKRLREYFQWTNWQSVAQFLQIILEAEPDITPPELEFASDLYDLLDRKALRGYMGPEGLPQDISMKKPSDPLFFHAGTSLYRGAFIGFNEALFYMKPIHRSDEPVFFERTKEFFLTLIPEKELKDPESSIFFNRS